MPGDHAVARDDLVGHAEVEAAMGDELVELFECARIEEQLHALAGRQFSRGVLALDPIGAAAELGAALEVCESVFGIHRSGLELGIRG